MTIVVFPVFLKTFKEEMHNIINCIINSHGTNDSEDIYNYLLKCFYKTKTYKTTEKSLSTTS